MMATDLSEAAEAVVTLCTDLGIERARSAKNIWEDRKGNDPWMAIVERPESACRVCVIGAVMLAHRYGALSDEESNSLQEACCEQFKRRRDFASELRTVPDTAAMFALIREAGKRG